MEEVDPLTGLRGLAATHVMIYHFFQNYPNPQDHDIIDLHGVVEVPVFYLLSGYSLALGYGANRSLNLKKYMASRFFSLLPLYWLTNLICLVVILTNRDVLHSHYTDLQMAGLGLVTLSCTNTWIYPLLIWRPFNLPSWFVNTLLFFYLVFPALLPSLQRLSDRTIARLLVILHLLQCSQILLWLLLEKEYGYWVLTAHPVCRLPVFLIGCLGGLQTLRWREREMNGFYDPNESQIFLHDILPWGLSLGSKKDLKKTGQDESILIWKRRADMNAVLFAAFVIFSSFFHHFNPDRTDIYQWTYGYSQLLVVHLQHTIILGLSRAGQLSYFGRLCSSRLVQWLGKISLCMYLLHFSVQFTATLVRYRVSGKVNQSLSLSDIFLLTSAVLLFSHLAQVYVQEPLRNIVKKKRTEQAKLYAIHIS